ncbi:hypothetical protein FVP60_03905 [Microbacterium mitrae]|uniref:Uncharacterized protein n=1 Tax=Microbacterium mitrae TaxID=664640 RepID=A0A5C8HS16_9MICO|nr:hypothetical protein FVP60_03905 [Microbacterium mitrae]
MEHIFSQFGPGLPSQRWLVTQSDGDSTVPPRPHVVPRRPHLVPRRRHLVPRRPQVVPCRPRAVPFGFPKQPLCTESCDGSDRSDS